MTHNVSCYSDESLLRETDGGGADGSTGTVDLGVAPGLTLAQVAALCNTSGLAVEGETSTVHAGTDQNLPVVLSLIHI